MDRVRRNKPPRTFGLEITIGFSVVVILVIIFLPRVHDLGASRPFDPCLFNLMWIQKAKVEWSKANHKGPDDAPSIEDIAPFLTRVQPNWDGKVYRDEGRNRADTNALPVSGIGCKFTVGKVSEAPTCSVHTNRWNVEVFFENYGGH